MLNSRHIHVSAKNANTGNFSLQSSDIADIVECRMKTLIVTIEGDSGFYTYSDDDLFEIAKKAIVNGRRFSKDGDCFYIASLKP